MVKILNLNQELLNSYFLLLFHTQILININLEKNY